MTVAKIVELVGCSDKSFEDAVQQAINKAKKTLRNIRGADVVGQNVKIKDGKIVEYRSDVKISFGVE